VSNLFEPITLRGTTVRNRAWVSPMCMYSSVDGAPTSWHLVHLGQFATGGAGLVMTEATAVTPEGRISARDAGIWSDELAAAYRPITAFLKEHGATPAIQLAHAGRKASTWWPWASERGSMPLADGGWQTVGPSAVAFEGYAAPRELSVAEIAGIVASFATAAVRAVDAGFEVLELHAAHGYLLHQFLSPLSNRRADGYGGDLAGRSRLTLEVVDAVRAAVGPAVPLLLRVSGTDWVEGGLTVEEVAAVAKEAGVRGVDLIDVSSGGNAAAQIPVGPGYQVHLARAVGEGSGVPTGAVGMITEAAQAEQVLAEGSADVVLLARAMLADPHWALHAAAALGDDVSWPEQYVRAK
jgi:2,4-dienoyl-CoA reductase-like NADH-dependent reductase (Old Yellow Enzyme family)